MSVAHVYPAHYTHSYQLNPILRFLIIAFLCRHRARLSPATCPTRLPYEPCQKNSRGVAMDRNTQEQLRGLPIQGASQQSVFIAHFTTARRFPVLGCNLPTRYGSYHPLSLLAGFIFEPVSFVWRSCRLPCASN